jgi:hypothetical protein
MNVSIKVIHEASHHTHMAPRGSDVQGRHSIVPRSVNIGAEEAGDYIQEALLGSDE